ncbi:hypothetical protein IEQ34_023108 [Dendrobium chrysotoxum]|uniref:KIB1-4 beta-propeller domain-containing protein n=1 Tax=Dendrobium chrysotoxum TaxID=161865 RepID=A0AAV7G0S2_DENCH|nr:hypothetical protein IEQ34_023108 [Dendrobium chrysotoxum]
MDLGIRNKLNSADLVSFRSVCSQWHSASPIPNPCPRYYAVSFDDKKNIIHLAWFKTGITREHFISLPFSLSSPLCYFGSSNGWLVFRSYNNITLYFFDPLSNRKFIFPPLKPMLLRYYIKVKPIVYIRYYAYLIMVVVSSSIDTGIAVAGIVGVGNRRNPTSPHRKFIFRRHAYGDCQRLSLLMEVSKDIIDIALAGDNRFYALSNNCELYMLDERPPLVKLKKIKLWLPKHILEPSSENIRRPIRCYGLKKCGETDLKVYGYWRRSDTFERRYISLKINVANLHGYSNNIEVACDAKWSYGPKCTYGNYQKWNLLMEEKFYLLDGRPSLIRLKIFKLWLPKHILKIDRDNDSTKKCVSISFYSLEESG